MSSFNRVILVGRLTRDPELRRVPSGTAVAEFALAVNRYFNDTNGERKEETSFIDVVVWGKRAETFAEYMRKGEEVLVEGRLKQDRWTSKENEPRSKLRVICENFTFLARRKGGEEPAGPGGASAGAPPPDELNADFDDPGAVPF